MTSFGILCFSNGDQYNGGWVWDKKQGHGVMTYADGSVYEVLMFTVRKILVTIRALLILY